MNEWTSTAGTTNNTAGCNLISTGKVRVGHIGAVGYMKNGEKILEISRKQLRKDGVLDEDFDIEWGS
ncbi:hypothetical protein TELCIR_11724 [Teladorsagia circumcincta]|uniref:Uncharacterized protein n=1 Tax=Teladorsagia circumcincta TaxID=45464 RepID=A0A2G9U8I6_TELCI|nr:hypothetical protein TELCIR_11724 [Teladorsagia circumcincta]